MQSSWPAGTEPSLRGRGELGTSPIDLVARRGSGAHGVLETLRAVDVDRLTPLDALSLVAKLKSLLEKS
jgi:DNA mismatch repair protein MutS